MLCRSQLEYLTILSLDVFRQLYFILYISFISEIAVQKEQLEAMVLQWRSYKEEYERLSDWLQQIDILVKAQKIALLSTVKEKEKQVEEVKEILDKLEKGQSQIETFNQTASVLLASHLDTYVNNQLRHLNSRYQVNSLFVNIDDNRRDND